MSVCVLDLWPVSMCDHPCLPWPLTLSPASLPECPSLHFSLSKAHHTCSMCSSDGLDLVGTCWTCMVGFGVQGLVPLPYRIRRRSESGEDQGLTVALAALRAGRHALPLCLPQSVSTTNRQVLYKTRLYLLARKFLQLQEDFMHILLFDIFCLAWLFYNDNQFVSNSLFWTN